MCTPCYNAHRRKRYAYDPEYRWSRRQHSLNSYDKDKERERIRQYRAEKRVLEQDQEDP